MKKIHSFSINCFLFFLFIGVIFFWSFPSRTFAEVFPEKPIVVVIPSYNNIKWLESNLNSVLMQKYSNYRVIYINDCSKDGTGEAVEKFIKSVGVDYKVINFDDNKNPDISSVVLEIDTLINQEPHFFILINNINRCGALENLYRAIQSCKNHEIIATLDGDDWFYHDEVLSQLNSIYSTRDVWFTHGTLVEHPWGHVSWCEPIPQSIIDRNAYREFKCPSHLRTFYAWLFKKIKLEDFLWNGKFFPMAWDMAIMYPMCEMAQERHLFITSVNYVYNMENSINDNKVDPQLQNYLDKLIRNKQRYNRLEFAE
jgi:glycosyltransferase involved in cell wall biosynthesis